MKRILHLLLLSGLFSVSTQAQIVNIESARMQSDTVGWLGGAGAAFNLTENTRRIISADLQAHLQYKTSSDQGLWLILANFGLLKFDDNDLVSDALLHLRYNKKVNEWLRWEVFGQFQNNSITQIDSRMLFGTGPRFKLIKNNIFRLYAASLAMYEREKEATTPVVKHSDIRSSSYVSFTYTPRSNLELISTTFFQPLFSNFSDYRILNQATFRVKATPHFSLSVKWNYLFDRFPAGSAPKTTYSLGMGVDYEL